MNSENNVLIVYYSVSGLTRKYARWLSARLSCQAIELKNVKPDSLNHVRVVIFISRFMAGKIDHLKDFTALSAKNPDKDYMIAVSGAMPLEARETIDTNLEKALQGTNLEKVPRFYLPAGLSYENLPTAQRLMLKTYAKVLKSKKNPSPSEKIQADMISSSFDQSDEKYLTPLVKAVESLLNEGPSGS